MNILRFDHTTADWVVFAPLRKLRPHHGNSGAIQSAEPQHDTKEFCPFCPGNEKMTPPEIYAVRPEGLTGISDWKVRVVSNKFPALKNRGRSEAPRRRSDVQLDGGMRGPRSRD